MDCLALFPQLPSASVDMILTDPPYGIGYCNQFTKRKHDVLNGDTGIDYDLFAKECFRILKMDSHAYFFTRFDCYPYHFLCLQNAGFTVKNCMVIEKGTIGGIGDLQGSYANNAEWIIFCQKGRRAFNQTSLMLNKKQCATPSAGRKPVPQYKTRFNACWFGAEHPKATYNSTWQKKHEIFHPTIKNVECLSWLIQLSSLPGDLIFDGFMGTGSTALAALLNGRNYLGAEINQEYYEIAQKRISNESW